MGEELDVLCSCGHRHAEHSMFDACHGCSDCGDTVVGSNRADDHRYRRCECRELRSVEPAEQIAG